MTRNERLKNAILQRLIKWRHNPPTAFRLLMAWPNLPLLAIVGPASVASLVALDWPTPASMLVAGMFFGAALRDVGIALRAARIWPVQRELYDWQKIETLAQGTASSQNGDKAM